MSVVSNGRFLQRTGGKWVENGWKTNGKQMENERKHFFLSTEKAEEFCNGVSVVRCSNCCCGCFQKINFFNFSGCMMSKEYVLVQPSASLLDSCGVHCVFYAVTSAPQPLGSSCLFWGSRPQRKARKPPYTTMNDRR